MTALGMLGGLFTLGIVSKVMLRWPWAGTPLSPYYRHTNPGIVTESMRKLDEVLADVRGS